MIRGDVLTVKGYDFVTLARITGVKAPVILWRHIFPQRSQYADGDHEPDGGADHPA